MISKAASRRRAYWVEEISKLSGKFGDDSDRLEGELSRETTKDGSSCVLDHLALCGTIPEKYGHDSSEEKLYSKYTDILLKLAFEQMGLRARVVKERADSADVEVVFNKNIAFVADAKAFRLSRTAKNQKDFKVQQMHSWKRGKAHAIVVCPIFQLPSSSSQIYQQASISDVCLMSYSHLSFLIKVAEAKSAKAAQDLLLRMLRSVGTLNPSKDATAYWQNLNRTMLSGDKSFAKLWVEEKAMAHEAIAFAKEEALSHLAQLRESSMRMSHKDAIEALIKSQKISEKERTIRNMDDNGLLELK